MHYYQELQKEKKQGQGTNKGNGLVKKGNINGSIEQYFIDKMLYSIISHEGLCLSSEVKQCQRPRGQDFGWVMTHRKYSVREDNPSCCYLHEEKVVNHQ